MKISKVIRSGTSVSSILFAAVMALGLSAGGALRAQEPAGFLGVQLGELPAELAAHLDIEGGAMVVGVVPASPAEKAGIRRHDIVVAAAGKSIEGPANLTEIVRTRKPGEKLQLEVRRGVKLVNLEATLGQAPDAGAAIEKPKLRGPGFLGVLASPVPPALAAHLGLDEGSGALVEDVREDSPAARSGIERHDILLQVAGAAVRGPEDLPRLLGERREGDEVELEVIHKGERRNVAAVLGAPPADAPAFDVPYGLRHRFPRLHLDTRPRMRGKLFWRDLDGNEHSMEIPELPFDPEEMGREFRDLGEKFHEHFRGLPDDINERVQELLRKYDLNRIGEPRAGREPEDVFEFKHGERRSMSRLVDGDLDITLRDDNGVRTVTVIRGGKSVAKDLPFDRIGTLPEDIRARVEKMIESSPEFRGGGESGPEPQDEPKKEPERIKLREASGVKI